MGCFAGVPFNFVCPVCRTEGSAGYVFGVSAGECLLLSACLVGSDALLSEPDGFDGGPYFGDDNVGFGGVVGGTLGLVIAANTSPC